MTRSRCLFFHALTLGVIILADVPWARAQTAAQPADSTDEKIASPITLSPFDVNSTQDRGYVAANTVAGSRISTPLSDTPAAISVFTNAFLSDVDALNSIDQLQYMLNGNRDASDNTGLLDAYQSDYIVHIRGIAATASRDYFDNPNSISLDGYNTDRVDFARGPNSTLFGIGNPGGVVNTSTKQAQIGQSIDQATLRLGSWDDFRVAIDENHSIGQKVAVRFNGVYQDRKSWQNFADMDLQGLAGAVTYRPFPKTTIVVQTEYDDKRQVNVDHSPTSNYMGNWLAGGKQIAPTDTTPVAGTTTVTSHSLVYDPTAPGGGLMSWYNTQTTVQGPVSPQITGTVQDFTNFSIVPRSVNLTGSGSSTNEWHEFASVFLNQEVGPVDLQLAYNDGRYSRQAKYPVSWNEYGVYADPNPLLPNGSPNPNVGQFYTQGDPTERILKGDWDTWRLMASYKLDLSAHYLGIHSLTGLLSRDQQNFFTDAQYLVNSTPAGTTASPLNEASTSNWIYERTYLNFNSSDLNLRGAFNPSLYPIVNFPASASATGAPVTAAYERISNAGSINTAVIDSAMVADQSSFFNGRVVVTAGIRNDVEALYGATGATETPVTDLFSLPNPYSNETVWHGNTRTVGGIVYVLPWLGFFYNNSDDFSPQTQVDLNSVPIGPKYGQDQDFGAKVDLWGRGFLTVTHYQLNQVNANNASDLEYSSSIEPAINDIWIALNQPQNEISTVSRDTFNTRGKGWEVELVGNILPGWTLMWNASQDLLGESNVLPRVTPYVLAHEAYWQQNAAVPLTTTTGVTGASPTIGVAAQQILADIALDQFTSTEVPRGTTEYATSAFSAYTFQNGGWLKAFTVGGGFVYTGRTVVGYNSTTNYSPIYSGTNLIFKGMLAKKFKLKKGLLKLQLNIDNLFNNTNLLINVKDNTGTYQYLFQPPQSWSVTTTYSF